MTKVNKMTNEKRKIVSLFDKFKESDSMRKVSLPNFFLFSFYRILWIVSVPLRREKKVSEKRKYSKGEYFLSIK